MKTLLLSALLCLTAGVALAQSAPQVQPIRQGAVPAQRVAPVRPAPVVQPVEQAAPQVNADIVDPQGTIDRLRENNRRLKAENAQLKDDVARLDARIREFTTRGGSEVRAYCAAKDTSRNTAGATQSCGPFACNQVSGLCHTSCSLTEHCSSGACYNGQCLTQAPQSDD
jgi:TolA-binding protein